MSLFPAFSAIQESAPAPTRRSEVQRQSVCKPLGDVSSEQQMAVTNVVIARRTDSRLRKRETRPRSLKTKLRDRRRVEAGTFGELILQGSRRSQGRLVGWAGGGWKVESVDRQERGVSLERAASSRESSSRRQAQQL